VGDRLGIKPVFVSAAALVWLLLTVRDRARLPIAWDPVLLALALAVLAGAVVERVDIGSVMPDGSGVAAVVMRVLVSMIAACAINNLPALLVLLPAVDTSGPAPWAVLLGVNMGPSFVITGALAGLLWRDTARRLGVDVSVAEYSRLGVRIAGPAVVGAVATFALIAWVS
jgi:arsenical pump membrane protein